MGVDQSGQYNVVARLEDCSIRDGGCAPGWDKLRDPTVLDHHTALRLLGKNAQGILDPKC
jgi:hypothetical protein